MHQAGVLTYPHQDANKVAYLLEMFDLKIWIFYFVHNHTKIRKEILVIIDRLITTNKTEHPKIDIENVYLFIFY